MSNTASHTFQSILPLPSSFFTLFLGFLDPSMEDDDEDYVWVCNACTFHNQSSHQACSMCYTTRPGFSCFFQPYGNGSFSISSVPRILGNILSGAVTGAFALVGAFTGAITGGLVGRAARSGLFRGAGLGAVAGAVLSVEVLEASRAYWRSERMGPNSFPSLSDFVEDLLSGRFVQDFVVPAVSATQRWQVNLAEMSYEELYEMFIPVEGRIKGASEEQLRSLPKHLVTEVNRRDASGDAICCAICLQDLEQGDMARTLPACNHTFHVRCVDRWLAKHVICPICRHYL